MTRRCLDCHALVRNSSRCAPCAKRHELRRGPSGWARQKANRAVMAATNGRCAECGKPAAEVDHILPLSHGGTSAPSNLRPLCSDCHRAKTRAMR